MEDSRLTNISFAQLKKVSNYQGIPPAVGDIGTIDYGDKGIWECIVLRVYTGESIDLTISKKPDIFIV